MGPRDRRGDRGERWRGPGYGPHGRFDDEAVDHGPQDWLSRNRVRLGTALTVGAGLVAARRLTRLLRG
ncbi:hypothetical protein [Streptomyces sp. NPDC059787]|uniref:hypothetical protein n=1 Tax=Streptomyces sp. NPDC059787 TaxID=3346947 RepID=UPI003666E8F4